MPAERSVSNVIVAMLGLIVPAGDGFEKGKKTIGRRARAKQERVVSNIPWKQAASTAQRKRCSFSVPVVDGLAEIWTTPVYPRV